MNSFENCNYVSVVVGVFGHVFIIKRQGSDAPNIWGFRNYDFHPFTGQLETPLSIV